MLCFVHSQKNETCQTIIGDVPAKHCQLFFQTYSISKRKKVLRAKTILKFHVSFVYQLNKTTIF